MVGNKTILLRFFEEHEEILEKYKDHIQFFKKHESREVFNVTKLISDTKAVVVTGASYKVSYFNNDIEKRESVSIKNLYKSIF